ncbi:MAG: PQQ-dependent sugar dehydrogenase [Longimicrobiales bacterium]
MKRATLALTLAVALGGCEDGVLGPDPVVPVSVSLQPVAQGLSAPVFLTAPAGDLERLFVVERGGTIRIVRNDSVLSTPFLDVGAIIDSGGEQGLLGMAFHPGYAANGRFFVNYTDTLGHTQIVRYTVSTNPDRADSTSAFPILTVQQPFSNHNGGMIAFGPLDGMLYVGMGDGGSGGDPQNHGQNRSTLLGDMLRLDVDGGSPYAIPSDNPFTGGLSVANEIWASGLRNPWRFSFDALTGDLYIGDVGQGEREEVSFQPGSSPGGENYGWRIMEGTRCHNPASGCSTAGLTLPVHEYDHGDGCSITGGYVYRGSDYPALQGRYFFADYCGTWLRSFVVTNGVAADVQDHTPTSGPVQGTSSFGEDGAGEIYIVSLNQGTVRRIVAP